MGLEDAFKLRDEEIRKEQEKELIGSPVKKQIVPAEKKSSLDDAFRFRDEDIL